MAATGSVSSHVDHRAPIFYDIDNTAYYADPGSTSVFNALTLSTLNVSALNVSGNTQLGNGNGDITHINDIVHIGAMIVVMLIYTLEKVALTISHTESIGIGTQDIDLLGTQEIMALIQRCSTMILIILVTFIGEEAIILETTI